MFYYVQHIGTISLQEWMLMIAITLLDCKIVNYTLLICKIVLMSIIKMQMNVSYCSENVSFKCIPFYLWVFPSVNPCVSSEFTWNWESFIVSSTLNGCSFKWIIECLNKMTEYIFGKDFGALPSIYLGFLYNCSFFFSTEYLKYIQITFWQWNDKIV